MCVGGLPEAHSPLRREALDAEALEEDTVRAEKEAALVGDEREDRRRSLMGAGPLLGQLHFLPSAEANRVNVSRSVLLLEALFAGERCTWFHIGKSEAHSPCVDAEAVKGRTGSKV